MKNYISSHIKCSLRVKCFRITLFKGYHKKDLSGSQAFFISLKCHFAYNVIFLALIKYILADIKGKGENLGLWVVRRLICRETVSGPLIS